MRKAAWAAIVGVALWFLGQHLDVVSIEPVEVARENDYYGTRGCNTAKGDKKVFCSEASCKNALIAQGVIVPDTSLHVYQSGLSSTVPERFEHYVRFQRDGVPQDVKCESSYMGDVTVTYAAPPRSIKK